MVEKDRPQGATPFQLRQQWYEQEPKTGKTQAPEPLIGNELGSTSTKLHSHT